MSDFVALISGWILGQGRRCISRVVQVAAGLGSVKHFATLYRFLSRGHRSADELGRVIFGLLLGRLPEARVSGQVAALHTPPLAFTACAVVVPCYLQEGDALRDAHRSLQRTPWYRHKSAPALRDMLVTFRREAWATRLSANPGDRRGAWLDSGGCSRMPSWLREDGETPV